VEFAQANVSVEMSNIGLQSGFHGIGWIAKRKGRLSCKLHRQQHASYELTWNNIYGGCRNRAIGVLKPGIALIHRLFAMAGFKKQAALCEVTNSRARVRVFVCDSARRKIYLVQPQQNLFCFDAKWRGKQNIAGSRNGGDRKDLFCWLGRDDKAKRSCRLRRFIHNSMRVVDVRGIAVSLIKEKYS